MFTRKVGRNACSKKIAVHSNYTHRFNLCCRYFSMGEKSHKNVRSIGYVIGGGACLFSGIAFGNTLKNAVVPWWADNKFSSVLADENPRKQNNYLVKLLQSTRLGVVAIDSWLTEDNNRRLFDYGVGFVDESSELIITNEAFVKFDAEKLYQVIFEDGTAYNAKVVCLDNHSDLAALRLCNEMGQMKEKGGIPTMRLRTSPLKLGERMTAVTMRDKDQEPSSYKVFSGILSSSQYPGENGNLLEMSTHALDGAFGGPVLDSEGNVVGVVTQTEHCGVSLSIPSTYVRKFIEKSLKHEKVIWNKEADIRQKLREEKEREEERLRKEMEELEEERRKFNLDNKE